MNKIKNLVFTAALFSLFFTCKQCQATKVFDIISQHFKSWLQKSPRSTFHEIASLNAAKETIELIVNAPNENELLQIIKGELRKVPPVKLAALRENRAIITIVGECLSYSMLNDYDEQDSQFGYYNYSYDPEIDRISHYGATSLAYSITYAVKELITGK